MTDRNGSAQAQKQPRFQTGKSPQNEEEDDEQVSNEEGSDEEESENEESNEERSNENGSEDEDEEDEEDEEESGESESDKEDDELDSCVRKSRLKRHYTAEIRLDKKIAENKKLKTEIHELKNEIDMWRQRAEDAETALEGTTLANPPPPPENQPQVNQAESTLATNGKPIVLLPTTENPFSIGMNLPFNWQTDPIGSVYKHSPCKFPHRIVANAENGERLFVVESRPFISIVVRLRNLETNMPANEFDINPTGNLTFVLEVLFADTQEVAKVSDFGNSCTHLFSPPEEQIAVKNMVAGEVSWTFRCLFSSRSTKNPRNRNFLLRARCINPEFSHLHTLSFTTPFSFKVISRQYQKKVATS